MYDALLQILNQQDISINEIRDVYMIIAHATGDDITINAISDLIRMYLSMYNF